MKRSEKPRRFAAGPGTFVMACALIVAGLSFGTVPPTVSPRADRPQRNDLTSSQAKTPVRAVPLELLKPEPELLLRRAEDLSLTPSQRDRIQALQAEWRAVREDLSERLDREARLARESLPSKPSKEQISASLAAFSRLSNLLDRERRAAWAASLACLNERQHRRLRALLAGGPR